MATQETVLALAVDVVARSEQAELPGTLHAAIAAAAAALESLDPPLAPGLGPAPDDWADLVLRGAWELTRAAHRVGTDLHVLLATLALAHAGLDAALSAPVDPRTRPRRDA